MEEQVKILCVDDERNVLKSLRRLFMDEEEYDILLAESGEEGLLILEEEEEVRLVVSDYRMPGMNGVDFLRQVCEQRPDTIRIVLSGYADTAAVVEAINLGQIYKFIPKPWNDEELKGTIATALQHQELQMQNAQLTAELQTKNRALQEVNDNLEHLVAQRTEALEVRNRVLAVSQSVLDVLPVAVIGIDPDQMVAQCNDVARDLFPLDGIGPLGHDRNELFPAEMNRLIDSIPTEGSPKGALELGSARYRIEGRSLDGSAAQGVVVVLIPEEENDG